MSDNHVLCRGCPKQNIYEVYLGKSHTASGAGGTISSARSSRSRAAGGRWTDGSAAGPCRANRAGTGAGAPKVPLELQRFQVPGWGWQLELLCLSQRLRAGRSLGPGNFQGSRSKRGAIAISDLQHHITSLPAASDNANPSPPKVLATPQ